MPGNGPSPSDVLQLYRSIRRLHRHMPSALKFIGNRYVRDEFARHRNAQPEYLPGFIKAWTSYRNTLSDQLQQASTTTTENKINLGTRLDSSELDNFTPEQLGRVGRFLFVLLRPPDKEGWRDDLTLLHLSNPQT